MTGVPLGRRLLDAGWKQGVLLPALAHSVIYLPSHPLTGIARRQVEPALSIAIPGRASHGVAAGILRSTDHLVVISQTCDILKSESEEPTILAMRAFTTDKPGILGPASRNSARTFLLDPARNLVVDATVVSVIEKPVLETLAPEVGAPDPRMERRLARWVAARFSRFAFPDPIVGAVIKPLIDGLRELQRAADPDFAALDAVEEVRLSPTDGSPPYEASLLFIVPEDGLPDGGLAMARLVRRMSGWLTPQEATLVSWDARHLYETSVGDYLDHERIMLDEYTYQGQTIQGIEPRFELP